MNAEGEKRKELPPFNLSELALPINATSFFQRDESVHRTVGRARSFRSPPSSAIENGINAPRSKSTGHRWAAFVRERYSFRAGYSLGPPIIDIDFFRIDCDRA
jgi:hypothetical protein